MEAILGLDQQDFAALDALYLISGAVSIAVERWTEAHENVLSFLTVLEVDAGQALELVFGGHLAESAGEMSSLGVQVCWQRQLYNVLTQERRCVTEGGEHRRRDVCMVVGEEDEELP